MAADFSVHPRDALLVNNTGASVENINEAAIVSLLQELSVGFLEVLPNEIGRLGGWDMGVPMSWARFPARDSTKINGVRTGSFSRQASPPQFCVLQVHCSVEVRRISNGEAEALLGGFFHFYGQTVWR
ncbi:hypothetical protein ACIBI8_39620 [Streptomyces sp. NPDC050529]|uniref:hypothetical protein n=1 Tax=unclassified Streptomyces TaxID=2593676 RepID=UPI00379F3163